MDDPSLLYTVEIPNPETHLVHVTLLIPPVPESVEHLVTMPAWTPGSYLIREYGRHVEGFGATDAEGKDLATEKVAKATWQIEAEHGGETLVHYQVYAHDLTVRTSHVNEDHAFLHGPSIFMFLEGHASLPIELEVQAPESWQVSCGLPRGASGRFEAADFDALVDSPIECGTHPVDVIELATDGSGPRVEVAWWGWEDCDAAPPREQVVADIGKIFPEAARIFADPDAGEPSYPFDYYLFICHLAEGFGGLEHRNSAALLYPRNQLYPMIKYERFLRLVAHELFHAWNVKRLRPRALGPFDYTTEAYTSALWVAEGLTSYYESQILVRAGLLSPAHYLKHLAERIRLLEKTPGRMLQSAEEASFDSWIKLYRRDENTPNSTISYYLKGELVGLLLDLEMRARSAGERCLDDVMRLLWTQYGDGPRGYEDDAPLEAIAEVADREVAELAESWARSTEELDFDATFARVGLRLKRTHGRGDDDEVEPRGWLGVQLDKKGPHPVAKSVLRGSPAEKGGLCPGDEIVALDGQRVGDGYLEKRLKTRTPGSEVRLSVFRQQRLRDVTVVLGEAPPDTYKIEKIADASDEARQAYSGWLRAEWGDEPKE